MSVPAGVFSGDWYEHHPNWTAVDAYTQSHLHPPARPNHAPLNAALIYSRDQGLPDISTYPVFSKMLALQCRVGAVTHALEVGTLGGYTPIWLTTMNPQLHVTAVEVDARHAEVARENLRRAGVADRVDVIVGKGLDVLPRLMAEIEKGDRQPFGLTYIDADKDNNWAYFDMAVKMSRPGASVYVDNVVAGGRLAMEDASKVHRGVKGARLLVENVGKDDRVDAIVQQTVAEKSYDGFLMAVVK